MGHVAGPQLLLALMPPPLPLAMDQLLPLANPNRAAGGSGTVAGGAEEWLARCSREERSGRQLWDQALLTGGLVADEEEQGGGGLLCRVLDEALLDSAVPRLRYGRTDPHEREGGKQGGGQRGRQVTQAGSEQRGLAD